MFLSNKWNIKEVLLFPAMKPTDEQAEMKRKMSERMGISVAAQAAKNIAALKL
jgi:hypothetical protein